jgi:Protein of unknown function (DUF2852)
MEVVMGLTEKLEQFSRPALMGLTVVAFALCWPVGLGMLVFLIGSRRMGCWNHGHRGQWYGRHAERAERRANERGHGGWRWGEKPGSGNAAFDEYREETLRRLEDEQREFKSFLDKLRFAKDKAEFDQFMADRRNNPPAPPPAPPSV